MMCVCQPLTEHMREEFKDQGNILLPAVWRRVAKNSQLKIKRSQNISKANQITETFKDTTCFHLGAINLSLIKRTLS